MTVEAVLGALESCREALCAARHADHATVLARCAEQTVVPQALAAIDLALWDLAGQRSGRPLWELLGAGPGSPAVAVNATIGAVDRAGAAAETDAALAEGFRCVKVKIGAGDDAGRVAAVRAVAGPDVALRLDANGAWSVEEARAALRALAPAGLELCEEPVSGLAAVAALADSVAVPVAIDETTAEPGAFDRRLCAAACLKLGRLGGVSGLLASARQARVAGYELYLASTFDGPLGIAAAVHAALAIHPDRPCGLATLDLFARPCEALAVREGLIVPPAGPGLGDGVRDWYAAQR